MQIDDTEGYPLTYFVTTKPFDSLFAKLSRYQETRDSRDSHSGQEWCCCKCKDHQAATDEPAALPEWVHHVRLTKFIARETTNPGITRPDLLSRHKPPAKGLNKKDVSPSGFEYLLEFSTDMDVRILLAQPICTVAVFGPPREASTPWKNPSIRSVADRESGHRSTPRGKLSIRMVLEKTAGRLIALDIKGDVRFQLPRGLVSLVSRVDDRWVATDEPTVNIPLGDSTIFLRRGERPRLSHPLTFGHDTIVRIGKSNVVARLGKLDLGGTARRPKLRFHDVDLRTSSL